MLILIPICWKYADTDTDMLKICWYNTFLQGRRSEDENSIDICRDDVDADADDVDDDVGSYCPTVILSYCHIVILSYCYTSATVILSYCHTDADDDVDDVGSGNDNGNDGEETSNPILNFFNRTILSVGFTRSTHDDRNHTSTRNPSFSSSLAATTSRASLVKPPQSANANGASSARASTDSSVDSPHNCACVDCKCGQNCQCEQIPMLQDSRY